MPGHMYMEENGLTAMLATKRSAGIITEVNLRYHVTHMPLPRAYKTSLSGFEIQTRCRQKFKTVLSDLCSPIFISKKVNCYSKVHKTHLKLTSPISG